MLPAPLPPDPPGAKGLNGIAAEPRGFALCKPVTCECVGKRGAIYRGKLQQLQVQIFKPQELFSFLCPPRVQIAIPQWFASSY
jgi:hypothetical protein